MPRYVAALALALWCTSCSRTEAPKTADQPQTPPPPAVQVPPAAKPDIASMPAAPVAPKPKPPGREPIAPIVAAPLAPPGPDSPGANSLRTTASTKPAAAPAPSPRLPALQPTPVTAPPKPVLDDNGIERLALTPGAPAQPAPKTVSAQRRPAALPASSEPVQVVSNTVSPGGAKVVVELGPAPDAPPSSSLPPAPRMEETPKSIPLYSAVDPSRRLTTINELILDCIRTIPPGGSYQADDAAIALLTNAVTIADRRLVVLPDFARPSFCSSATYLVFLNAMDRLHRANRIHMQDDVLESLLVKGQPDGEGIWGRWNANGPGTARFFHELGIGKSFTNPMAARPGDFLKIWWNDEIGSKERGHSVVFLGMVKTEKGEVGVRYWSSNKPGGFGEAIAPIGTVKRMLFSRLDNPRGIMNAPRLPPADSYLADMLRRPGTEDEMFQMCGVLR